MDRILGNRIAELEGKLKALEMSGLWSLPGNHTFTLHISYLMPFFPPGGSLLHQTALIAPSKNSAFFHLSLSTTLLEADWQTSPLTIHCKTLYSNYRVFYNLSLFSLFPTFSCPGETQALPITSLWDWGVCVFFLLLVLLLLDTVFDFIITPAFLTFCALHCRVFYMCVYCNTAAWYYTCAFVISDELKCDFLTGGRDVIILSEQQPVQTPVVHAVRLQHGSVGEVAPHTSSAVRSSWFTGRGRKHSQVSNEMWKKEWKKSKFVPKCF